MISVFHCPCVAKVPSDARFRAVQAALHIILVATRTKTQLRSSSMKLRFAEKKDIITITVGT